MTLIRLIPTDLRQFKEPLTTEATKDTKEILDSAKARLSYLLGVSAAAG
jgi:hypothetical protein